MTVVISAEDVDFAKLTAATAYPTVVSGALGAGDHVSSEGS
ncbi:MAG: hypothetical protein AAB676_19040 [Verrucomicrobiota bacterium]